MSFSRFIEQMAFDTEKSWRKTALNEVIKGVTIDTCFTPDTQAWETGIKQESIWVIVEEYENEEKAKKGHKKWVELIKKNPKMELTEGEGCTAEDWFYGL